MDSEMFSKIEEGGDTLWSMTHTFETAHSIQETHKTHPYEKESKDETIKYIRVKRPYHKAFFLLHYILHYKYKKLRNGTTWHPTSSLPRRRRSRVAPSTVVRARLSGHLHE